MKKRKKSSPLLRRKSFSNKVKNILYAMALISMLQSCGITSEKAYFRTVFTETTCQVESNELFSKFGRWQSTYQCYDKEKNSITGSEGKEKGLSKTTEEGGCYISDPDLNDNFQTLYFNDKTLLNSACEIVTSKGDLYRILPIEDGKGQVLKISPDGTIAQAGSITCKNNVDSSNGVDRHGCESQSRDSTLKHLIFSSSNKTSCFKTDPFRTTEFYNFPTEFESTKSSICAKDGSSTPSIGSSGEANQVCIQRSKKFSNAAILDWFYSGLTDTERAKTICEESINNIDF